MTKKNKILFIAKRDCIPANDGGQKAIFYSVKSFAEDNNFDVYFSHLSENKNNELASAFYNLNIQYFPYYKNIKDDYYEYAKNILNSIPLKIKKYQDKQYLEFLSNIIVENDIDIIFVHHLHMAYYGKELKKKFPDKIVILREHDIVWDLVKLFAKYEKNILIKLYAWLEYYKTKKYEKSMWQFFDKVYFISNTDLIEAKKECNKFDISNLLYEGIEISVSKDVNVEENSFIYSVLKSVQNIKNLEYFVKQIWTPFFYKHTECKLYLTGSNDKLISKCLGCEKEKWSKLNIVNLGFVDDIKKTIQEKQFVVSPTLFGSGIRMKVLEAMALNKIVFVSDIDYKMCHKFKDLNNIIHFNDYNDFLIKYEKIQNNKLLQNQIMKNEQNILNTIFSYKVYVNTVSNDIKSYFQ